ncbi:hypothetical protein IHE55_30280 [Streptomyces pactum]|uniref:Lipoprotein n=1 Tax=Streptomyces pactum TaxID=68249 RepID=A0ABS0NUH1_9ACTN|nr:hypothetical protein [Streptomyces pactum]MBH5338828.1 hypothetical protein [Streptomyces pactum]
MVSRWRGSPRPVPVDGRRRAGGLSAVLAGGLAAGLLLTGCTPETVVVDGRGSGGDGGPRVRGAADALVRAGSSRVRTTVETVTGGTRVAIRGRGGYDFDRRRGRLRLVLPRDASGTAEHRPITELLAAGAVFMRNRGAGVPDDKWVRVVSAGAVDGNLVTGGATDPLTAAELLRAARGVRLVGRERLDGTAVRHYQGVTDIGRAARAASPAAREVLGAAARGFTEHVVAFDAYLDERGRLRKVRHRFTMAERWTGSGVRQQVVSTTELYDFGARVTVRLPDPEDIFTGTVGAPRG